MAFTLPRGWSPGRLLIAFLVLVSLLAFRSYYLAFHGSSEFNDYSYDWWKGNELDGSITVSDDGLEHSQNSAEDHGFIPEIPDFTDPVNQTSTGPSPASSSSFASAVPACRRLPGADKVVVMVKTGATEALARIPEQIVTLADCVPKLMIFSDMEQEIGEFHLIDALDEVSQEYKDSHEDFEFYKEIHELHAAHGDLSTLGSAKGWDLDKWKNIPMLHKAYTKYPDADWYVTIDADTYLGWTNLLLFLDRLDPNEPFYAGAINFYGPVTFAHGGTGYVLSRNAVERFESIRTPERIADWEKETSTICCGDVMLSVAMSAAGVNVSGVWPMFQGDAPADFGWNERLWCTPAITWHHIHSYDIEALWQFEREWINKTWDDNRPGAKPYLFADLFDYFVQDFIAHDKKNWDNKSGEKIFTRPHPDHVPENTDWDWKSDEEKQELWDSLSESEKAATGSIEACRAACEAEPQCLQFSWHPGTCKLDRSVRLGHAVEAEQETMSGWNLDHIERFKKLKDREHCEIKWDIDYPD
ncbi:hypothetical protein ABEF92_002020 [Exophiala dermatitidis]|uniref:N-acetylgalactosaminide beta-1,3-galactosyltransferase n=1 Tax=Exophiala dermatitidis (strain ATCC 34100 / CBS 525.76 / NIH/UT8656) TaxID=858893 RepID=H6C936_EXODN|nr:uncharacterized protein HMPREF1120_08565 [Exophiala dermatitidis NIH/UT8656]EHY60612.1 hypothetical protein HMPREF1120_08565 [Exophiala dermatitidis NIH/UT8656]